MMFSFYEFWESKTFQNFSHFLNDLIVVSFLQHKNSSAHLLTPP